MLKTVSIEVNDLGVANEIIAKMNKRYNDQTDEINELREALAAAQEEAQRTRELYEQAREIIIAKNAAIMELKRNKGIDELESQNAKLREALTQLLERAEWEMSRANSDNGIKNVRAMKQARAALEAK